MRGSFLGKALAVIGASGECQLIHGSFSSFIRKAPLLWLSNGPLPWLGSTSAAPALPAKTQVGPGPTAR
jgi:hypothetical protein